MCVWPRVGTSNTHCGAQSVTATRRCAVSAAPRGGYSPCSLSGTHSLTPLARGSLSPSLPLSLPPSLSLCLCVSVSAAGFEQQHSAYTNCGTCSVRSTQQYNEQEPCTSRVRACRSRRPLHGRVRVCASAHAPGPRPLGAETVKSSLSKSRFALTFRHGSAGTCAAGRVTVKRLARTNT